jgi:hypothetical protein
VDSEIESELRKSVQAWWLKLVNLTTQEAEIDQEDHSLRLAQAKSSQDSLSPIAGCDGTHLSSQLHRKEQIEGSWLRPAQVHNKTLSPK